MEDLSRRQKQVLVLLLAGILLGAGSLLYQRLQRGPVEILTVTPVMEPWPEGNIRGEVVVHLCGAVALPGVYHLPVGSRVYEALEAAGGALPGARVDLLNLASLLRDGERIQVPAAMEPVSTLTATTTATGKTAPVTTAATATKAPGPATGERPVAAPRPGGLIDPNTEIGRAHV